MKRIVSILLSVMFVISLGATVLAQKTPSIDNREHRQQRRIRQGVRSGSLTRLRSRKNGTTATEDKAHRSEGEV